MHQHVHYVRKEMDKAGAMEIVNGRIIYVWQLVVVVVSLLLSLVVTIVPIPAASAHKGMVEHGATGTANGIWAPVHVCIKVLLLQLMVRGVNGLLGQPAQQLAVLEAKHGPKLATTQHQAMEEPHVQETLQMTTLKQKVSLATTVIAHQNVMTLVQFVNFFHLFAQMMEWNRFVRKRVEIVNRLRVKIFEPMKHVISLKHWDSAAQHKIAQRHVSNVKIARRKVMLYKNARRCWQQSQMFVPSIVSGRIVRSLAVRQILWQMEAGVHGWIPSHHAQNLVVVEQEFELKHVHVIIPTQKMEEKIA
jgi:hypothetical protein